MLHAGLDLSRKKLDVCLLSDEGEHLDQLAIPPDVDSLRRLARRIGEVHREPVCAVVESMTGARLIHDTLEREGWAVEIADAQKVKVVEWVSGRRLGAAESGDVKKMSNECPSNPAVRSATSAPAWNGWSPDALANIRRDAHRRQTTRQGGGAAQKGA